MTHITGPTIQLAQDGNATALEDIIRGIQKQVYQLAIRMLADPDAAQDATQEILIRVVTKLSTFRAESRFETWVYRVATNYLIRARKIRVNDPNLTFDAFSQDLIDGLSDDNNKAPDEHVMLNELRIKCTMAMLLCLDREHRAAYILGDILEFDHSIASDILEISPANYRKRLSRARDRVQTFTAATCGLANRSAACSCRKRLPAAMASGRIGIQPSAALADAPRFADAAAEVSDIQSSLIAAKLQRSTGAHVPLRDYASAVLNIIETTQT
ncbi:RNA polymerase sigma factor [Aestuariibius sp. HNIBRBA575]|uniref:RNA polymerase sigma factor n=1 Tax=Aestuariibius sp. HNIBRBA575 TaxID=3233343 RepID=UPI0034A4B90F